MNSPKKDYPLLRVRNENENYSLIIVDDLISGINDWKSVQDIVRLTFKALSDVVKCQGETLKELELQIPTKAPKSDISACLAVKSSYNETLRTITEVKNSIESKLSIDEAYSMLDEKVSKSELQYLLGSKANYDEVRNMYCEKNEMRELQAEVRALRSTIQELSEDNYRKIQQCATLRDFQQIQSALEDKASSAEVAELLEEKANKQSVANALHRKANRSDMDSLLQTKADLSDFTSLYATVEELSQKVSMKVEQSEFNLFMSEDLQLKVDKTEFDETINSVHILRKELENKAFTHLSNLEGFTSSIKSELEEAQSQLATKSAQEDLNKLSSLVKSIQSEIQELGKTTVSALATKAHEEDLNKLSFIVATKADKKELDSLAHVLENKAESDEVQNCISHIKEELNDINSAIRLDFHKYQDFASERSLKTEQCCKIIQEEISRLHESLRMTSERTRENFEETFKNLQIFVNGKADELRITRTELEKIKSDISELDAKKSDRMELRKCIENKVECRDLQESTERCSRDLLKSLSVKCDEIRDMLIKKEKELMQMIDSKPNVHEINNLILENSLTSIRKSYKEDTMTESNMMRSSGAFHAREYSNGNDNWRSEFKALDSKMSEFINEQLAVNETLCAENCLARWLWRSGEIRGGYSVPWEVESVNTCPENFLWESGNTYVVLMTPGLYEITFAVFASKKPSIELLVNGEPIMIEFNSVGKTWGRHSDGNIVGVSAVEFVAVPGKSRVSMTYSGDVGEGFLGIKKL